MNSSPPRSHAYGANAIEPLMREKANRILGTLAEMKRLIINADDFGLAPGVNRAIVELQQAGALSSTTLMATAPYFLAAVYLAFAQPALAVGCHVVLVDGSPLPAPGRGAFPARSPASASSFSAHGGKFSS